MSDQKLVARGYPACQWRCPQCDHSQIDEGYGSADLQCVECGAMVAVGCILDRPSAETPLATVAVE